MTVEKTANGSEITMVVSGRLDTTTSPQLEEQVRNLEGVTSLIFDFSNLEYLSSAGLRVILGCQKIMNRQGEMVVKNVNDTIREIFDITGFSDILNIQ